jgi:hypothetical protein
MLIPRIIKHNDDRQSSVLQCKLSKKVSDHFGIDVCRIGQEINLFRDGVDGAKNVEPLPTRWRLY